MWNLTPSNLYEGDSKSPRKSAAKLLVFHGKFTISVRVVHKHIVNICTQFE